VGMMSYTTINEKKSSGIWKKEKLGNLVEFKNGLNFRAGENGHEVLMVGVSEFKNSFILDEERLPTISVNTLPEDYLLKNGDFIFVRSNGNKELIGRVLFAKKVSKKVTFSGFTIRARKKSDLILDEYCATFCSSHLVKKQFMTKGGGSNINNLNQQLLSEIEILIPPIPEQKGILKVLNLWDKAIDLKEKLIEQKKEQKKGLMQRLLTGKVRLPGFKGEWIELKIKDLIKEVNDRTTQNNQYEVLSVTKNGIVPQREQFNKQIASENNTGYKIVRRYNLVFSTMNLWMGSLDVLTTHDIGIVSPAYKVFEFNKQRLNPLFGKYFMLSDYMIRIYKMNSEQGASIVRRNLDMDGLLSTIVCIPPLEEQLEISKVLQSSDDELTLLNSQLEALKQQKKGLMQLLLTGKVRVKC
jgi:type I restriction enzyme, S subunit